MLVGQRMAIHVLNNAGDMMSELVDVGNGVEEEEYLNEKEIRTEKYFRKAWGDSIHGKGEDRFPRISPKEKKHSQSLNDDMWVGEVDGWDDDFSDLPPNIWED